jgi:hypothetical protein
MDYRHAQQAIVPLVGWIAFNAVLGFLVPSEEWAPWIGVFLVGITLVMIVFSRLTVTVSNEAVVTAFGLGWPRHTESISEIISVKEVRNTWIQGWGIRKISGGWMYNVAGYDAVELELTSGKKFRVGTDEPAALHATLSLVIPPRSHA